MGTKPQRTRKDRIHCPPERNETKAEPGRRPPWHAEIANCRLDFLHHGLDDSHSEKASWQVLTKNLACANYDRCVPGSFDGVRLTPHSAQDDNEESSSGPDDDVALCLP